MIARSWRWRVVQTLVAFAILEVVFTWVEFEPDALRLGLLVALCVAVLGLVQESLGERGPLWSVHAVRPMSPPGSDVRLAAYVRLVENHLTARTPDRGLRDRLVVLCDERLERRRGLRRTDPEARTLLGEDLLRDLEGPPRRLSRDQIDDYLRRIEEL
ncbi:MAG TPA: hypothetical protein VFT00_07415 [Nocardioides sp.]|nr:hypothetical protein [Nocardioides sp.]